MTTKLKILNFFYLSKEKGRTYSSLITLDRYLVNVEKDLTCTGQKLNEIITDLINDSYIYKNEEKKYSITQKGLEYLEQNKE